MRPTTRRTLEASMRHQPRRVTRDARPRQLPTVSSHAVPTGEYQSDPPSLPRAIRCSSTGASPSTRAGPLDSLLHIRGLMWVRGASGEGMRQAAWSDRCSPILERIGEWRDGRDAQCAGPQPSVPMTHIKPLEGGPTGGRGGRACTTTSSTVRFFVGWRRPARLGGDQWAWPCAPCARAWPLPREIRARLTKNVGPHATASAIASEPQKRRSPTPASIAPGQSSKIAVSTISIVVIESVSATRAIPTAAGAPSPHGAVGSGSAGSRRRTQARRRGRSTPRRPNPTTSRAPFRAPRRYRSRSGSGSSRGLRAG